MMLFQSVIIGLVEFAAWFQLQMPIPGSHYGAIGFIYLYTRVERLSRGLVS